VFYCSSDALLELVKFITVERRRLVHGTTNSISISSMLRLKCGRERNQVIAGKEFTERDFSVLVYLQSSLNVTDDHKKFGGSPTVSSARKLTVTADDRGRKRMTGKDDD